MLHLLAMLVGIAGESPDKSRLQQLEGRLGLRQKRARGITARVQHVAKQYDGEIALLVSRALDGRPRRAMLTNILAAELNRQRRQLEREAPRSLPRGQRSVWVSQQLKDFLAEGIWPQVHVVEDWATATRPNLGPMRWADACHASEAWHEEFIQSGSGEGAKPGRLVLRFEDGFTIQQLQSEQALREEGRLQNHCVASYWNQVRDGSTWIYSLRDATGQPKVTIEIKPPHTLAQAKGKGNRSPTMSESVMVQALIDHLQNKLPEQGDPTAIVAALSQSFTPIYTDRAKAWRLVWVPETLREVIFTTSGAYSSGRSAYLASDQSFAVFDAEDQVIAIASLGVSSILEGALTLAVTEGRDLKRSWVRNALALGGRVPRGALPSSVPVEDRGRDRVEVLSDALLIARLQALKDDSTTLLSHITSDPFALVNKRAELPEILGWFRGDLEIDRQHRWAGDREGWAPLRRAWAQKLLEEARSGPGAAISLPRVDDVIEEIDLRQARKRSYLLERFMVEDFFSELRRASAWAQRKGLPRTWLRGFITGGHPGGSSSALVLQRRQLVFLRGKLSGIESLGIPRHAAPRLVVMARVPAWHPVAADPGLVWQDGWVVLASRSLQPAAAQIEAPRELEAMVLPPWLRMEPEAPPIERFPEPWPSLHQARRTGDSAKIGRKDYSIRGEFGALLVLRRSLPDHSRENVRPPEVLLVRQHPKQTWDMVARVQPRSFNEVPIAQQALLELAQSMPRQNLLGFQAWIPGTTLGFWRLPLPSGNAPRLEDTPAWNLPADDNLFVRVEDRSGRRSWRVRVAASLQLAPLSEGAAGSREWARAEARAWLLVSTERYDRQLPTWVVLAYEGVPRHPGETYVPALVDLQVGPQAARPANLTNRRRLWQQIMVVHGAFDPDSPEDVEAAKEALRQRMAAEWGSYEITNEAASDAGVILSEQPEDAWVWDRELELLRRPRAWDGRFAVLGPEQVLAQLQADPHSAEWVEVNGRVLPGWEVVEVDYFEDEGRTWTIAHRLSPQGMGPQIRLEEALPPGGFFISRADADAALANFTPANPPEIHPLPRAIWDLSTEGMAQMAISQPDNGAWRVTGRGGDYRVKSGQRIMGPVPLDIMGARLPAGWDATVSGVSHRLSVRFSETSLVRMEVQNDEGEWGPAASNHPARQLLGRNPVRLEQLIAASQGWHFFVWEDSASVLPVAFENLLDQNHRLIDLYADSVLDLAGVSWADLAATLLLDLPADNPMPSLRALAQPDTALQASQALADRVAHWEGIARRARGIVEEAPQLPAPAPAPARILDIPGGLRGWHNLQDWLDRGALPPDGTWFRVVLPSPEVGSRGERVTRPFTGQLEGFELDQIGGAPILGGLLHPGPLPEGWLLDDEHREWLGWALPPDEGGYEPVIDLARGLSNRLEGDQPELEELNVWTAPRLVQVLHPLDAQLGPPELRGSETFLRNAARRVSWPVEARDTVSGYSVLVPLDGVAPAVIRADEAFHHPDQDGPPLPVTSWDLQSISSTERLIRSMLGAQDPMHGQVRLPPFGHTLDVSMYEPIESIITFEGTGAMREGEIEVFWGDLPTFLSRGWIPIDWNNERIAEAVETLTGEGRLGVEVQRLLEVSWRDARQHPMGYPLGDEDEEDDLTLYLDDGFFNHAIAAIEGAVAHLWEDWRENHFDDELEQEAAEASEKRLKSIGLLLHSERARVKDLTRWVREPRDVVTAFWEGWLAERARALGMDPVANEPGNLLRDEAGEALAQSIRRGEPVPGAPNGVVWTPMLIEAFHQNNRREGAHALERLDNLSDAVSEHVIGEWEQLPTGPHIPLEARPPGGLDLTGWHFLDPLMTWAPERLVPGARVRVLRSFDVDVIRPPNRLEAMQSGPFVGTIHSIDVENGQLLGMEIQLGGHRLLEPLSVAPNRPVLQGDDRPRILLSEGVGLGPQTFSENGLSVGNAPWQVQVLLEEPELEGTPAERESLEWLHLRLASAAQESGVARMMNTGGGVYVAEILLDAGEQPPWAQISREGHGTILRDDGEDFSEIPLDDFDFATEGHIVRLLKALATTQKIAIGQNTFVIPNAERPGGNTIELRLVDFDGENFFIEGWGEATNPHGTPVAVPVSSRGELLGDGLIDGEPAGRTLRPAGYDVPGGDPEQPFRLSYNDGEYDEEIERYVQDAAPYRWVVLDVRRPEGQRVQYWAENEEALEVQLADLNREALLGGDYFEELAAHIAGAHVNAEYDFPGILRYPLQFELGGAPDLDPEVELGPMVELYISATPGWDGDWDNLPIGIDDPEGGETVAFQIPIQWTGDLERDAALWEEAVLDRVFHWIENEGLEVENAGGLMERLEERAPRRWQNRTWQSPDHRYRHLGGPDYVAMGEAFLEGIRQQVPAERRGGPFAILVDEENYETVIDLGHWPEGEMFGPWFAELQGRYNIDVWD